MPAKFTITYCNSKKMVLVAPAFACTTMPAMLLFGPRHTEDGAMEATLLWTAEVSTWPNKTVWQLKCFFLYEEVTEMLVRTILRDVFLNVKYP